MKADIIEIVWTLSGGGGLVYCLYCLWDYVKVRSELLLFQINGDVIGHIGETIRRESIRALIQTLMTAAGVAAMFRPPTGGTWDAGRLFIISTLMLMSWLHVLNTHLDRRSVLRRRKRGDHKRAAFEELTTDTLERIENAGSLAAEAARTVKTELEGSQGRADAIEAGGAPGTAADAASRSKKED